MTWRDQTRIPRGMQDFARWWKPVPGHPGVAPSDVDALLHSKYGDRLLMLEFKPARGRVSAGQRRTLLAFSAKDGCCAIVVHDPHSRDDSRQPYDPELTLDAVLYLGGREIPQRVTLARLVEAIHDWYLGTRTAPSSSML